MRVPRIYQPQPLAVGETVELSSSAVTHVGRVLRLRTGAPLILFNGQGGEYRATIDTLERRRVTVTVDTLNDFECESPLQLTLAQGISKGDRMDYTIQKAVELGVSHIIPVRTERSVVNLSADRMARKLDHWRATIISACEQCGRNRLPEIEPVVSLAELLEQKREGAKLMLDHRAKGGLSELNLSSAILLIGPEGGLSEREREAAIGTGYIGRQLGPRVLRTETAAVTAIALLQSYFGDLG